jgi:hypothetical protein
VLSTQVFGACVLLDFFSNCFEFQVDDLQFKVVPFSLTENVDRVATKKPISIHRVLGQARFDLKVKSTLI